MLRQMLQSHDVASRETKNFAAETSSTVGTSAAIGQIAAIAQGDTVSGRTGNQVTVKRLHLRLNLTVNSAGVSQRVRFIVFCDRLNTGTAPTGTDVLNTASLVYSGIAPSALVNQRFKIYEDVVIPLSSVGANFTIAKEWDLRMKDLKVSFTGTGAGNSGSNSLYFLLLSSDNTNQPTYAVGWNLFYYDD